MEILKGKKKNWLSEGQVIKSDLQYSQLVEISTSTNWPIRPLLTAKPPLNARVDPSPLEPFVKSSVLTVTGNFVISLVQKGKDLSNSARVGTIQSVTNQGKVDPQVPMKILCH